MTVHATTPCSRRLLAGLACAWAGSVAFAQPAGDLPHPADPRAAAAPLLADESLPRGSGAYLDSVDAPRLPWTRLYRADGSFVPEAELRTGAAASPAPARTMQGHDHSAMASPAPAPTMQGHDHSAVAAPAAPPASAGGSGTAASDARGVVRAVDREQGKVTLKHGPIPRLEMPGMTMIFRVRDAALLEGLAAGQEVGFDVEVDGTTFYVTRFSR